MASICVSRCCQLKPSTLPHCLLILTLLYAVTIGAESKPPAPPTPRPLRSPSKTKSPPPTISSPSPRTAPPPSRRPPSPRPPPLSPPSPRPPPPARDGIRLVGGTAEGVGRLEMFVEKDGYGEWTAVCGLGGILGQTKSSQPQSLCELLGYRYGRLYYGGTGLNKYTTEELEYAPSPQFLDACPLSGNDYYFGAVARIGEYTCEFARLLQPPVQCKKETANLVALQCSNSKLPPAPPPTPKIAPPPPPPFEVKDAIRLLPLNYAVGRFVELLVNTSSNGRNGPPVWAPLCTPEGNIDVELLADTICSQFYVDRNPHYGYLVAQADTPQPIQKGNVTIQGFNPVNYTHWVTVVGGVQGGLYAVHQMDLKVTTEPCPSGFLFRTTCSYLRS